MTPPRKRPSRPAPPSSASFDAAGELKDTPANRALRPRTTDDALFGAPALREGARYSDPRSVLLEGDVRTELKRIADAGIKVNCVVTSPPFYGQRDYGVEGQLGLEPHPRDFIAHLVDIFQLCGEVLEDHGSLWVNLGDTYWSGKGAHKSREGRQSARRFGSRPQDARGDGGWARPKQLLLIPHRFAVAMQDAGWLVRNDNIWVKPNPIPDQVRDRSSISHEFVFHFTKARWYYYERKHVARKSKTGSLLPPLDTWVVETSRGRGSHKASFSKELVRIPILATTPPGGIVLDPFAGSGTSMIFAKENGFRSIGIDLSPEYCDAAAAALRQTSWPSEPLFE